MDTNFNRVLSVPFYIIPFYIKHNLYNIIKNNNFNWAYVLWALKFKSTLVWCKNNIKIATV